MIDLLFMPCAPNTIPASFDMTPADGQSCCSLFARPSGRRILAQELWNAARFWPFAFMLVKLRLKYASVGVPFAGGLANRSLIRLFRFPGCHLRRVIF